jgi:2'-5' RNA ligase
MTQDRTDSSFQFSRPSLAQSEQESRPTYFVGVRPPALLAQQICLWQQRLGHVITEPHVTLKAPGRWEDGQIEECRLACQRMPRFQVRVGRVQTFGERVISLTVSGPGLNALHGSLVAAVGEAPGTFELSAYHPHLTLALSWRPMTGRPAGSSGLDWPLNWVSVLASAQTEFAALQDAPLEFEAREAVLYRKQRPGEPYHEADCWALE